MLRSLVTAVPVLTVAGVALLVLVLGAERPVSSVRVWGGPTDTLRRFSAWIQVEDPASELGPGDVVRVEARSAHGGLARSEVRLNRDRRAEVALDFERPPGELELGVLSGARVLGAGRLGLARQVWLARVRRLGGVGEARAASAGLAVEASPLRGVFAVPFADSLVGRVERGGVGILGAEITLTSDGASLSPARVRTDAQGNFAALLTPREHIVTLRVTVLSNDGARAELFSSVPVLPGALVVERRGAELLVTSPVERASADVSLVSESGRWFGARVSLSPSGDGRAFGSLPMPELPESKLYAVVSSDATVASAAAVGWPLFATPPHAEQTFDAVDRLLLDTFPAAEAKERARRRGVRRWALLLGSLGAAISVAAFLRSVARVRTTSLAELERELGDEPSRALLPGRSARALLAAGLVLLGFLAIAAIAAWRLV